VERDKLRIKLDQLRSGKTFEELDQELDVQVLQLSLKLHLVVGSARLIL